MALTYGMSSSVWVSEAASGAAGRDNVGLCLASSYKFTADIAGIRILKVVEEYFEKLQTGVNDIF